MLESNLSKKERLDKHISSDQEEKKSSKCEKCDKTFASLYKLGDHISAIHEGKNVTFVTTDVLKRVT